MAATLTDRFGVVHTLGTAQVPRPPHDGGKWWEVWGSMGVYWSPTFTVNDLYYPGDIVFFQQMYDHPENFTVWKKVHYTATGTFSSDPNAPINLPGTPDPSDTALTPWELLGKSYVNGQERWLSEVAGDFVRDTLVGYIADTHIG